MNKTIAEPPGRHRSSQNTHSLKQHTTRSLIPAYSGKFVCAEQMVQQRSPETPVHCLRPATITAAAKWFLKHFPGDVMFAVKTNPDARVLNTLSKAGIKHYDVASLVEIQQVAQAVPGASMHFMHPVKSRTAIRKAYFDYGIRDFSLDSHEELAKILEETNHADDLGLFVRLSIPNDKAAYSLSGKFGVPLESAASLLMATRKAAATFGVCFHVGSQCMNPESFALTMHMVADLMTTTDVKLDVLDVGGGFPSIYPGMTPPSLIHYMTTIKDAVARHPQLAGAKLMCEPGRALVAEAGSVVVRVEHRRGNMLFINDGTYGTLFDAGTPGFLFPVKPIRLRGSFSEEIMEFGFFGPTCDSMDVMQGPFHLPADIGEGDWIEIGQLGAYGATMQTKFNGFYSDVTVELTDKPILCMNSVN